MVYEFEHDGSAEEALEVVFARFNSGSGQECEAFLKSGARSLSVNDFVRLDDQWWQCMSMGWEKVSPEYVHAVESRVSDYLFHYPHASPWQALGEVMDFINGIAQAIEDAK